MNEASREADANLKKVFETAVNRHGHPFQYAVIRRAEELFRNRKSRWVFEVSEFPVEVQGDPTRIDFILSIRVEAPRQLNRLLVAECKRTNPSHKDWLFTRAPYMRRDGASQRIIAEHIWRKGRDFAAGAGTLGYSQEIYHLAFEVKGSAPGESGASGRGSIEVAATQVTRGVNGLVECLAKNQEYVSENHPVWFIPAIFTTAQLWSTEEDIAAANLADGTISLEPEKVHKKPWLWLQYHVSPGLQHSVNRDSPEGELKGRNDLGDLLEVEYARCIAIIGRDGIDTFLATQP